MFWTLSRNTGLPDETCFRRSLNRTGSQYFNSRKLFYRRFSFDGTATCGTKRSTSSNPKLHGDPMDLIRWTWSTCHIAMFSPFLKCLHRLKKVIWVGLCSSVLVRWLGWPNARMLMMKIIFDPSLCFQCCLVSGPNYERGTWFLSWLSTCLQKPWGFSHIRKLQRYGCYCRTYWGYACKWCALLWS